jgi:hypothetical protein
MAHCCPGRVPRHVRSWRELTQHPRPSIRPAVVPLPTTPRARLPLRQSAYTRANCLPLLAVTKPSNTSWIWFHDLSFFMLSNQRLMLG